MASLALESSDEGVVVSIKVVPGSRRTMIAGVLGDKLKVKVAAAPEKGKANEAVIALLSHALGIKPAQIRLIDGLTHRVKRLLVTGLSAAEVEDRLCHR